MNSRISTLGWWVLIKYIIFFPICQALFILFNIRLLWKLYLEYLFFYLVLMLFWVLNKIRWYLLVFLRFHNISLLFFSSFFLLFVLIIISVWKLFKTNLGCMQQCWYDRKVGSCVSCSQEWGDATPFHTFVIPMSRCSD